MSKMNLRFWQNPRIRYGSVSTLLLCLFLAILFTLNGAFASLEKKHGWRRDYSFNALATYTEDTQAVLDRLETPVEIYALFEYGQEDLQLFALLDRYAAGSDMVTWEQRPLSLNPAMATTFQGTASENVVSADSLIVYCPGTDRFRVLQNFRTAGTDWSTMELTGEMLAYENEITFALSYVTQPEIPVVYVISGHREISEENAADFSTLLRNNHYDVRYATLAEITLTPDDLVVFLSPRSDLTRVELQQVTDFVNAGGNILFSCTATDPLGKMPNYRELMRLYGFIPLEGIVYASKDEPGTYDGVYPYNLYVSPEPSAVTYQRMFDTDMRLPMVYARAFQTPELTINTIQVKPLLYSGSKSFLHDVNSYSNTQAADDPTGPFVLGMECYRFSETGEVSRAVALGSTSMLTAEENYSDPYAMTFILLIMEYLVDSDALDVIIPAKAAYRPKLDPAVLSAGSMVLVILPLAVLAAALLVLVPRYKEVSPANAKHKQSKT